MFFYFVCFICCINFIIKEIGTGGFGCVFLCVNHDGPNRFFAVKRVSLSDSFSQKEKQFGYMSRLNSRYLVKYHETFTSNNDLYVVMDYYENGNLYDLIKNYKEKEEKIDEWVCFIFFFLNFFKMIENILLSLLMGVYTLHFEGIIHRDIKPNNIFIDRNNHIALG
jgi:serine/threonine protein kinase